MLRKGPQRIGRKARFAESVIITAEAGELGTDICVVIKCYCPSGTEICLTLRGRHEIQVESQI